jgi:hypothetical protein
VEWVWECVPPKVQVAAMIQVLILLSMTVRALLAQQCSEDGVCIAADDVVVLIDYQSRIS